MSPELRKQVFFVTVYSVSGVKCYHKYNVTARTWRYIPVTVWRRMTSAQRNRYANHSFVQIQAAMTGRFGYAK